MAILVLGGAGYIGSHTVRELLNRGEDVVIIDNLQSGHMGAVDGRARFYKGDIRDRAFLDEALEKENIEAVIHFAANSLVGESMKDPLKYYDNNVGGAITLLQALRDKGVDKIVFSSTAAAYGEPEKIPIEESDATVPKNPYGETKLAMEKLFGWADKAHGIRFVSLRYFNAAGADESGEIGEDHHPETHLIPLILEAPLGKRDKVLIYGDDYDTPDGTCIRDYIHVTDLADAHIKALGYLRAGGKSDVFNLGTGSGVSVKEVIDAARKVTGRPIPAEASPRREGDPARLTASNEKAKRVLQWDPRRRDVAEIVSTAWKWHKSHPDGYADNQ